MLDNCIRYKRTHKRTIVAIIRMRYFVRGNIKKFLTYTLRYVLVGSCDGDNFTLQ